MSIRDWLIVVGGVILLVVVVDLIRRYLQRGKLKLSIDKKFTDLPDIDISSELPNGGARLVRSAGDADASADGRTEPSFDPAPVETLLSEPVEAFESTPVEALVSRPVEAFESTPVGTLESTPVETFESTPVEALVSRPVEAFESTSVETLASTPINAADSASSPAPKVAARPRRVIVDDALLSSPAFPGDSTDEEVDLLLQREFKGVGQGADDWLGESRAVSEPRAEFVDAQSDVAPIPATPPPITATATPATMGQEDNVDAASESGSDPDEAGQIEPLLQQPVDDSSAAEPATAVSESDPAVLEPESLGAAVALVEDDVLDLERPVHELLQRQQSAVQAAAADPGPESPGRPADKPADSRPERSEEASVADSTAKSVSKPKKKAKISAKKRPKRAEPRPEEQPSFFDLHPDLAPEIEPVVEKTKSRRRRKKAKQAEPEVSFEPAELPVEQQVLVINVQAKIQPFPGSVLFKLVSACGLEYGSKMSIYHRFEGDDGQGALQFSMANAIAPGIFDPAQAEGFSTPAVTFFLQLADPADRMNAFECMLATAQCVADNLNGELKDENRSSLRTQTIEHYRQKVREFERKQLTRRV